MSRSRKGKSGKGPGYEYWSARPGNRGGGAHGKYSGRITKTRTHRDERREGKQQARENEE
jgi:hypothetical protein